MLETEIETNVVRKTKTIPVVGGALDLVKKGTQQQINIIPV